MKIIILFAALCVFTAIPLQAQIEDIFDKTKEKIEDEIKKEQKEKEKKEKEKLEKQKAEKEKAEEQAKDTVRVSDYHRLHKGEIAFINVQNPELTGQLGFGGRFGEKEDITACIYMDKRLESYELPPKGTNSFRKYFVKCYIDGAEFNPRYNGRLDADMTAFALRLQGSQGILTNAQGYWDALNKLAPGDHTLKIEIWGGDVSNPTLQPVAAGEYVLLKDAPPPVVLKKFSDIVPGKQNKKLEQQALDAINRVASAEGWKERYYKAVITSYDWYIERNEWTGIIICRKLYLTMLGTWPDGSCKYTEFGIRQDHDGSRFSDVMQYNSIGGMYDAECE